MADNITLPTTGTGTATPVVATDDVGGIHYQFMKLVDGTLNNACPVVVSASGGVYVSGQIAHDAPDTGQSIKLGGEAILSASTLTPVADQDHTDFFGDVDGFQIMKPFTPFSNLLYEAASDNTGNATAFANFGACVGCHNYLTTLVIYNSSSTGAYVQLRDGTGGTQIFTVPAPPGGGAAIQFPVPLRQPSENTALAFDASAAITTIFVSAVGFRSKA